MATNRQGARTVGGSAPAVKKRSPKKKAGRRGRPRKNPPTPAETVQRESSPQESSQDGGLMNSLGSLFGAGNPSPSNPTSQPQKESENPSSSDCSTSPDLPEEVERKLDAIPDVIGQEGEQPTGNPSGEIARDDFSSLLDMIAFEEQDVRDLLEEAFDWLSEKFDSEHWKLSERQSRMLGRPTVMLMNSIWLKLRDRLPDVLLRWCESTPGAAAFITAAGIVIVPKVMTQVSLSKRKKLAPAQEGEKKTDAPSHISAPAGPSAAKEGSPIVWPHGREAGAPGL